jgi:hypothetical protein
LSRPANQGTPLFGATTDRFTMDFDIIVAVVNLIEGQQFHEPLS